MQTTIPAPQTAAKLKPVPEQERRARLGSRHLMESKMARKIDGGAVEECLFDDAPAAIDARGQVEMF